MEFYILCQERAQGHKLLDLRRAWNKALHFYGGVKPSKRKASRDSNDQDLANAKRTFVDLTVFGVELEGCYDQPIPQSDLTYFTEEHDGSISCPSLLYEPREYISKKLHFHDLTDPIFQKEYVEIVKKSRGCAKDLENQVTCGTHVHMSHPSVPMNSTPGFLLFLAVQWIRGAQPIANEKYYKLQCREDSAYCGLTSMQDILNGNKYSMLNVNPSVDDFEKYINALEMSIDEDNKELQTYIDSITQNPPSWHVEFRGLGEIKTTIGDAPFNRSQDLWSYVKWLAEFYRDTFEAYKNTTPIQRLQLAITQIRKERSMDTFDAIAVLKDSLLYKASNIGEKIYPIDEINSYIMSQLVKEEPEPSWFQIVQKALKEHAQVLTEHVPRLEYKIPKVMTPALYFDQYKFYLNYSNWEWKDHHSYNIKNSIRCSTIPQPGNIEITIPKYMNPIICKNYPFHLAYRFDVFLPQDIFIKVFIHPTTIELRCLQNVSNSYTILTWTEPRGVPKQEIFLKKEENEEENEEVDSINLMDARFFEEKVDDIDLKKEKETMDSEVSLGDFNVADAFSSDSESD